MSAFTQDFIIQQTNRKKHKPAAMDVPARLWNPDGTPFTGDSSKPVTPADGSVTNAMLAGGITADKLASGVIPATPTADTLSGATDTGKAVLKAASAEAARGAIGAGTPYTLPAAGTALGGVKKGTAVATVTAADAVAAAGAAPTKAEYDAVVTELNETKRQLNALLASLKAAGTIA